VTITILDTKAKIVPLIRYFREVGVYTEKSYNRLLERMAEACNIPRYPKNFPVLREDDSAVKRKGYYEGTYREKILKLYRLPDIKSFLCLWHIYLSHRNCRFSTPRNERIVNGVGAETTYAKDVLELSEPKQVRNWEQRAFVEEMEL